MNLILFFRAWWTRVVLRRDVSAEWLRVQDGKDWTRGYEGVSCKWDEGARWEK